MDASNQLHQQADFRGEVLASPDYRERCSLLFPLFRLSREIDRTPNDILAIQGGLAELLVEFQQKQAEFRQEGNDLGVALVKRLILILNQIADSLVWRVLGYDRILVQLISEHSKTGHLDGTVVGDFALAQKMVEQEDAIVLVNDLTTILRHGDLTKIGKDVITLIETKHGKASKRDRRAARQRSRLDELVRFANTGVRVGEHRRDFIFKADVPVRTHHSAVAAAIAQARSQGYHRVDVSDVIAIEALWTRNQKGHFPRKRPFEKMDHITRYANLTVFDRPTTRIAPYGIFPLDHRSCWDVITGEMVLVSTLDFDSLQDLYRQLGLQLELPEPGDQQAQAYLSAPIAERMKLVHDYRFTIRADGCEASLTPDLFGRIGLEFIDEETVVQADRQLMKVVRDLDIADEKTTRFYIGYKDESGIWV
jgi:hypothetical protein